jgi:hypothetical protein
VTIDIIGCLHIFIHASASQATARQAKADNKEENARAVGDERNPHIVKAK